MKEGCVGCEYRGSVHVSKPDNLFVCTAITFEHLLQQVDEDKCCLTVQNWCNVRLL